MEQEFASTLLENAVSEFAKLPGIGRKTALRLVLYLLRQNESAWQFEVNGTIRSWFKVGTAFCPLYHLSNQTTAVHPSESLFDNSE